MKIVSNERLILRNKKIGQTALLGGVVVLGVGLYLTTRNTPTMIALSYVALLAGIILSQLGIYFANRWGRNPRPDELLAAGLKGLDDHYTLYTYASPVPYLLQGPSALWILLPYHQGGTITYEKNRWKQKGGNWYLKLFAQEGIGRPDLEVSSQEDDLTKSLKKTFSGGELPSIKPVIIFTNPKAIVDAEDAAAPTIPLKKLKDFIRKKAKETPLSETQISLLEHSFGQGKVEKQTA